MEEVYGYEVHQVGNDTTLSGDPELRAWKKLELLIGKKDATELVRLSENGFNCSEDDCAMLVRILEEDDRILLDIDIVGNVLIDMKRLPHTAKIAPAIHSLVKKIVMLREVERQCDLLDVVKQENSSKELVG
jgi:hypothetical protein